MKRSKLLEKTVFFGLLLALASPSTWAATTYDWVFNSGSCLSNCGNSSHTKKFSSSPGGTDVITTAWKTRTASNDILDPTKHYRWSGGLGVNWDGGTPQHSTDNNGPEDAILFDFGKEVTLNSINLGWAREEISPDRYRRRADITVLAHTGSGDPSLSGKEYDNSGVDPLTDYGWEHIGDYNNVPQDKDKVDATAINSGAKSSRYWLIGAFNHRFDGGLSKNNDYAKIWALAGTIPKTPPPVPEPAALLLLGMALPFMRRRVCATSTADNK